MLEHNGNFEMTVPFGTIRGKIWHDSDRPSITESTVRVLALHGWQDNCGTFDRLIPLLPRNFYVVAIDFPGHGLSSHVPPGCPYNDTLFVIEVERVVQHLGWKGKFPFTILGHSMGAAIGMFYACLYPDAVKRIISLDMIKPLTFPADKLAEKTREGIEQFMKLESKAIRTMNGACGGGGKTSENGNIGADGNGSLNGTVPLYDHQEAITKLITAHSVFGKITAESAEILLKRGARPAPGHPEKVYFTRDNRLKAILFQRMDSEALMHYLHQLRCELLIVKAENGVKLDPEELSNRYIELYRAKCPRFDYVRVPGGHHVHLCQPENVHEKIHEFVAAGEKS